MAAGIKLPYVGFRRTNRMTEPLEGETHEKYLEFATDKLATIADTLGSVLEELQTIRTLLRDLPEKIASEMR
jgi:hypothetical protein